MTRAQLPHVIVPIQGLQCAACVSRLEKAIAKHDGVKQARVNLALETLDMTVDDPKQLKKLPSWITTAGFSLDTEQATLTVENITCAACINRIEKVLNNMVGVQSAMANLATSQVKVTWFKGLASLGDLKSRLKQMNYPVKSEETTERSDASSANRLLIHSIIGLTLSAPMIITMLLSLFANNANTSWMLPNSVQCLLTTPVLFGLGFRFYKGAYHSVKNGSANMDVLVALGTSAAYFYSLFLWLSGNDGHVYFEAAAVVVSLVLLGKWMEVRAKYITGNAIRKLMHLQPSTAQKWQGDQLVKTDVNDLTVGDELQIQPGDTVPADGDITAGASSVNESMLTGESIPVTKTIGDTVLAGTQNIQGSVRVTVRSSPEQFRLKQIADQVNDAQMQKPNIQKTVDKIAAVFVPIVLVIACFTFALQWWLVSLNMAFIASVSVLVIACPCALGLATPTAIMAASGVGARRGVLIRDVNQLQAIANADTIAFDKTGTLTEGTPEVVNCKVWSNEPLLFNWIKAIQQNSQHPLAAAMVKYLEHTPAGKTCFSFTDMSGRGVVARSDTHTLLIGNERLLNEHDMTLSDTFSQGVNPAASLVWVAVDGEIAARFDITDPVREDAKATLSWLKRQGLMSWMLTGDHDGAANTVAQMLAVDQVMSNLLPEHKAQAIQQLQKKAHGVIMVGDGINDAPALAFADASIAMGNGTDVAMESAGLMLMRSDIGLVIEAIQIAKKTQRKIKQNLFWAFIYNAIGIPLAAAGLLNPVIAGAAMAFSSVSVVSSSLLLLRWNPIAVKEGVT